MVAINCHFPLRVRVAGRLDESRLEALGETLSRTLLERIAFAEETVRAARRRRRVSARDRRAARRYAAVIAERLASDPAELAWRYQLEGDLRRVPRGPVFELMLAELETTGLFDRLFAAVEEASAFTLHELLLERALETRFARHQRLRRSIDLFDARRRSGLNHAYRVAGGGEIWLDHDRQRRVRANGIFARVDAAYSRELTVQRIRPARLPEFQRRHEAAASELLADVLAGRDDTTYTPEGFAMAALERTASGIGPELLGSEYLEEVVEEWSVRLIAVRRLPGALERHQVTIEEVKRVGDVPWEHAETVPDSRQTLSDAELEEMFAWWPRRHGFDFIRGAGTAVAAVAVAAAAAEAGLVALLARLAGGTGTLAVSIGFSEVLYLLRAERTTPEGFFLAALNGCLGGPVFRVGSFLGTGLALRIGTRSLPRVLAGLLAQRLTAGAVGGAGSAALATFTEDLVSVLLGQRGWSSPEAYVRAMNSGAALGVLFEFAGPAVARIAGPAARQSLGSASQVAALLRRNRFSAARWTALSTEALGNLRRRLEGFLEPEIAARITGAFRERVVEVMRLLPELPGRIARSARVSIYRRVLELSRAKLTPEAVTGLERLLGATSGRMSNDAMLAFVNRLARRRGRTARFLEAVGSFDDGLARGLARRGELTALVEAEAVLTHIGSRGPASFQMLLDRSFGGSVAGMEGCLGRLARLREGLGNRGLEALARAENRVAAEGLLQILEKTGRLSDDMLAGLDGLYGSRAARADLETFFQQAAPDNLDRLLGFLGRVQESRSVGKLLHDAAATGRVSTGILEVLLRSPRILEHAGRLAADQVRPFVKFVRPPGMVRAFENLLARTRLSGDNALRALLEGGEPQLRSVAELEAAVAVAVQRGYPDGASRAIGDLRRLIGDDVDLAVARQVLELPATRRIVDTYVAGPGKPGPDVLFTTGTGRHIGREVTSTRPDLVTAVTAATARAKLLTGLRRTIRGKIRDYRSPSSAGRPGLDYARREVGIQIRPAASGFNFDRLLGPRFFKDLLARFSARDHLELLDRIRFYDAAGRLVFTWSR